MFVNLNIPSFGELLRKLVFSFKSRTMNLDNLLVNDNHKICYIVIVCSIALFLNTSHMFNGVLSK